MKIEFYRHSIAIYKKFKNWQVDEAICNIYGDCFFDTDANCFILNRFKVNPRTAYIDLDEFVEFLARLYELNPFRSIELPEAYEVTGEQLLQLIKNKIEKES